jgi:AraC-like DNA-binding protein
MARRTHRVTQHRSGIAGIEAMTLFSDHAFPRHSHDHFGIGIVTSGAQRSWSVAGHVEAEAGDVIMCNPCEMHDGMPSAREPRGWRILYFDPSFAAVEIAGEERGEMIVRPVVRDARLAVAVTRLFASIECDVPDTLAVEERLLQCLLMVSRRHRLDGPHRQSAPPSIASAIERLEDAPEMPITLAALARLSGVSRFQLLRGFRRAVGVTPHAYLIQRRVRLARKHLAAGLPPSEVAFATGFADQSHMTRAFARLHGVTPARFQRTILRQSQVPSAKRR